MTKEIRFMPWSLGIGHLLVIGIWTLVISPSLLDPFDADDDLHLFTDAAGHEGHPELAALDGEAGLPAGAVSHLRLLLADLCDRDGDRLGHAAEREVAGDVELGVALLRDRVALEREGGELLGVEEVRRAQVVVALLVARVDLRGLERDF